MNGIQLVLVTGIVFIGLYFIIRLKKRLLDIVLLTAMIACGIVLVLWPDVTNIIANRLGVGRGADLIFYLSILIFWFIVLKLYARIRKLEQLLTELIRNDAIKKATDLSDPNN
jgi:small membrane protein